MHICQLLPLFSVCYISWYPRVSTGDLLTGRSGAVVMVMASFPLQPHYILLLPWLWPRPPDPSRRLSLMITLTKITSHRTFQVQSDENEVSFKIEVIHLWIDRAKQHCMLQLWCQYDQGYENELTERNVRMFTTKTTLRNNWRHDNFVKVH